MNERYITLYIRNQVGCDRGGWCDYPFRGWMKAVKDAEWIVGPRVH